MSGKVLRECFLRCCSGRHPDIPLPHRVPVTVGRGPVTRVTDPRCSRRQVALTADTEACTVTVTQLGANSSLVRGAPVGRGAEAEAGHGDPLELVAGAASRHTLLFSPPPGPLGREGTAVPGEAKATGGGEGKRPREGDEEEGSVKRRRGGELPWMQGGAGRLTCTSGWAEWRAVAEGGKDCLLVATEQGLPGGARVAAFDLDFTVIGTQSGKVFPRDIHDWRFLYPEVPGHLKKLSRDGFKIVFITNQAGIARGKLTVEDFRTKITRIREKLGVPLQVSRECP
jgi:bifunctional polynucleotide phosphatase/kinase